MNSERYKFRDRFSQNLGENGGYMFKAGLIVFSALFFVSSFAGELCSNVGRATTTDQKSMSNAIALGFLNIKEENIYNAKTENYVSWKVNQEGCLADIIHYAKVSVLERRGNDVCETVLDLHTKDYFSGRVSFEREYKPRNVETNCFTPEGELANTISKCEAMPKCPMTRDGLQTRDIFNNCECSFLYDKLDFEDVVEFYEGFFNPEREFKKPEGLSSPFDVN